MKRQEKISHEQKEMMEKLGEKIKQLRIEQNKGYILFAKEIGIPKNTYYNIENGILNFQFSSLCQILLYYKQQHNISPEEIFKDLWSLVITVRNSYINDDDSLVRAIITAFFA